MSGYSFIMILQIAMPVIACFAGYKWREAQANKKRMLLDPPLPNGLKNIYGFIFGKKKGEIIAKNEYTDGHILVVGSTRSGKSSCIAIPTLKAWRETAFVIDIKGELYEKTKQVRYNVKKFDPLDKKALRR